MKNASAATIYARYLQLSTRSQCLTKASDSLGWIWLVQYLQLFTRSQCLTKASQFGMDLVGPIPATLHPVAVPDKSFRQFGVDLVGPLPAIFARYLQLSTRSQCLTKASDSLGWIWLVQYLQLSTRSQCLTKASDSLGWI